MSFELKHATLAYYCEDVSYGYTESATVEPIGPKFLRITDIQGGTIDWSEVPHCPATAQNTDKYSLEVGDIVVARTGNSTGENAQILSKPPTAVFASYLIRFRPDFNRINPFFLGYQLRSDLFKQYVLSVRSGSAQPGANAKQLGAFPVQVIERDKQDEVVKILRALDDRIALLRETNATLEAIAQALFKSWFVDFDPVHANAGTQAPSLPPEIQALFPATFTDSPHGPIPEGWEVKQLGEVTAYLNRGISPKYVETGGVVVINQKCIRDFAVDLSKARRHDPIQRKIDGRILEMGDILVNSTGVGTLGRVAQLLEVNETMIIDSHVTAVRANSELSWPYLGLALMRKQPEIEAMGEGTTGQTELARAKLAMLPIVCPPEEVLKVFDDIVTPLKKTLAANATKAENLSTLRDTLLPRLISGQLRLPEAEQAIAAITD